MELRDSEATAARLEGQRVEPPQDRLVAMRRSSQAEQQPGGARRRRAQPADRQSSKHSGGEGACEQARGHGHGTCRRYRSCAAAEGRPQGRPSCVLPSRMLRLALSGLARGAGAGGGGLPALLRGAAGRPARGLEAAHDRTERLLRGAERVGCLVPLARPGCLLAGRRRLIALLVALPRRGGLLRRRLPVCLRPLCHSSPPSRLAEALPRGPAVESRGPRRSPSGGRARSLLPKPWLSARSDAGARFEYCVSWEITRLSSVAPAESFRGSMSAGPVPEDKVCLSSPARRRLRSLLPTPSAPTAQGGHPLERRGGLSGELRRRAQLTPREGAHRHSAHSGQLLPDSTGRQAPAAVAAAPAVTNRTPGRLAKCSRFLAMRSHASIASWSVRIANASAGGETARVIWSNRRAKRLGIMYGVRSLGPPSLPGGALVSGIRSGSERLAGSAAGKASGLERYGVSGTPR